MQTFLLIVKENLISHSKESLLDSLKRNVRLSGKKWPMSSRPEIINLIKNSMTLTKKQMDYLTESTGTPWIRPTLAYVYYLPEVKKAVSTDSFRLHEVSIDLWDMPLYFNKKGESFTPTPIGRFPNYEGFFPTDTRKYNVLVDCDKLKLMDYLLKPFGYHATLNFKTRKMSVHGYNPSIEDFKCECFFTKAEIDLEHDIGINAHYLHTSLRHYDKANQKTVVAVESKSPMSPFVTYWTIDSLPVRSLIMPIKIKP